ncbi:hypothetical protein XENTR_v10013454 [Xenopus tropicalis]|nr:hypothetical protein XENTR_v10013454 [Xenopus tropicalis]|eukprot:XP_017949559.1 PREDICTED: uncharacterized protein LOC105947329 [Xenopus tropicalis]
MLRTSQSLLSGRRSRNKRRSQWIFCCCFSKKRQSTFSKNVSPLMWSVSNSQDEIYSESQTSSFDVIHDVLVTQADEIVAEGDHLSTKNTHLGRESSVCHLKRPNMKKRLVPLISLLPLHIFVNKSCKAARDNVADPENSPNFKVRGKLLSPPQINLIPPTPSDVINNEQFFESTADNEGICIVEQHGCIDRMDDMSSTERDRVGNDTSEEGDACLSSHKNTTQERNTEHSQDIALEHNALNETGETLCPEVFGYVRQISTITVSMATRWLITEKCFVSHHLRTHPTMSTVICSTPPGSTA